MRKVIILLLALLLCASPLFSSMAEETSDYSWLDDLSIRQLKELDKEIHKRIPYDGEIPVAVDTDKILGEWVCEYREHDYFKNNPTNHMCRTTYIFLAGNTGEVDTYDMDKKTISASGNFSYELKEANTLFITTYGLLTSVTSMTIEEDENGIYLKENNGRIFRKKE